MRPQSEIAPRPTPPPPAGVTVYRDLAYVENGHERQKLDLYLPDKGESRPLIIWIHGGAFRMGSKEGNIHDTYVTAEVPPFLIVHGEQDPLVLYGQSVLLVEALQKAGTDGTFYTVAGAGHGNFTDPQVPELTAAFLTRHLGLPAVDLP